MHFSIFSIGKSNTFISCLRICSLKLTPFRRFFGKFSVFWHFIAKFNAFLHFYRKIQCILSMQSFYRKIKCVFEFLSQNLMRSFHASSYALWNSPLSKNRLGYFRPIFYDLTFYCKILCIFAFLSKNPMRSFHAKSQTFSSKSRNIMV